MSHTSDLRPSPDVHSSAIRRVWTLTVVSISVLAAVIASAEGATLSEPIVFRGACDGSAATRLGPDLLLVASDNSNVLLEYSEKGGEPTASLDLYSFLDVQHRPAGARSRIEGVARLGDLLFVSGSHARNHRGVNRPDNHRLFALKIEERELREAVRIHGKPNSDFARAIESDESLRKAALSNSILALHIQLTSLAPSRNGFSIGALAAGKDGESLLVGLRSPIRAGRAIVLPVLNPGNLVLDFPAAPKFGEPIMLSLAQLGVVAIEPVPRLGGYLILAAPADEKAAGARLFSWSGDARATPEELHAFTGSDFSPETIVPSVDGKRFLLLSDDGHRPIPIEDPNVCRGKKPERTACNCNMLLDQGLGRFQGRWLTLPKTPSTAD